MLRKVFYFFVVVIVLTGCQKKKPEPLYNTIRVAKSGLTYKQGFANLGLTYQLSTANKGDTLNYVLASVGVDYNWKKLSGHYRLSINNNPDLGEQYWGSSSMHKFIYNLYDKTKKQSERVFYYYDFDKQGKFVNYGTDICKKNVDNVSKTYVKITYTNCRPYKITTNSSDIDPETLSYMIMMHLLGLYSSMMN